MKTVLYFVPHQDDELLTMSVDICNSLEKGYDVHVVLLTDGSQSSVRKRLNAERAELRNKGIECPDLTEKEFAKERDEEFKRSLNALGVDDSHIHLPSDRQTDGSLTQSYCETTMKSFLSEYGKDCMFVTINPRGGDLQHKDHVALGKAGWNLVKNGTIPKIRFFIEPYLFDTVYRNPRLVSTEPQVIQATGSSVNKIDTAIDAYRVVDKSKGYYGIGYRSVKKYFNDYKNDKKNYYYIYLSVNYLDLCQ